MNLQQFSAKVCFTVASFLIHNHQVLLIKHKKLGIWLAPGGHLEAGELPHQAAEREFWEEAGIKVKAVNKVLTDQESEYLPNPILSNLHWISEENYQARQQDPVHYHKQPLRLKGCEQHLCWIYLVEPVAGLEFKQNTEETDGIGWFTVEEVMKLDTTENIKSEVKYAFSLKK